nr:MAG TPA: hypothetical protein [Caudoviricetes sp.]
MQKLLGSIIPLTSLTNDCTKLTNAPPIFCNHHI